MAAITNAQRVVLGPLTTTFTRPAQCSTAIGGCSTCNVAWLAQACVPGGVQDDTACWPPATQGVAQPSVPLKGWGFYSPGVQCPQGYTTACSATAGGATGWKIQFLMAPSETAVGCCPLGYNCANQNGQTCISIATSTTVTTATCKSGTTGGVAVATLPNPAISVPTLNVYAPMIHIAWQPSDRPEEPKTTNSATTSSTTKSSTKFSSSSRLGAASVVDSSSGSDGSPPSGGDSISGSSTLTSKITGGTGGGTPGNGVGGSGSGSSTDSSPPSSAGSSGLSGTAIAGIAIGIALVLVGFIVAAVFVWWKKRQQGGNNGAGELPGSTAWPSTAISSGSRTNLYFTDKPLELSSVETPRYEVPSSAMPYEAPRKGGQAQELPGSHVYETPHAYR